MDNFKHYIGTSRQDELKETLDKSKGEIVKIFELVCPTEISFKRSVKNMHNIFDDLLNKIVDK
jgi:hypothetical protein